MLTLSLSQKSKTQEKTWISNIDDNFVINRVFEQNHKELVQDEKNYVWNVTQEKRRMSLHRFRVHITTRMKKALKLLN